MVVPTPDGARNPLVLAAAHLAGVSRAFAIGGAQAIAALAYGTATIPAVDKICGPGNAYVAAAKRRVFGAVGIDMVAGVSEILVIADASADPDWVAMDLFSQAEHDELAQAILVSPDAALLDAVAASAQRQIATMPRRAIIAASFASRGALIAGPRPRRGLRGRRTASRPSTSSSPSPIRRRCCRRSATPARSSWGTTASEALGDYCAGPNHVLPTGRTARFSSPLGVYDFQKRSSLLAISTAARAGARPRRGDAGATAKACRRTRRARATASARSTLKRRPRHARPRPLVSPIGPVTAVSQPPDRAVADVVAATVRPEIRALTAYAVAKADGHDQARRDGESVRAARAGAREARGGRGRRCRSTAIPTAARDAVQGRAAPRRSASRTRSALLLGNGSDELIQIITSALARPGAAMLAPEPSFVMYRMNALYAGMRFVGVPLRRRLRARRRRDAGGDRARAAGADLPRLSEQSDRQPVRGGRRRARSCARRRGSSSSTRPTTRSPTRASCRASREFPNLLVLRTVSKIGMAGLRLGYAVGRARVDRRTRQGAPAV